MSNYFKNKRALVTGGTGSIGSEIVRQLLKNDISEVVVFSRDEIKQFMMRSTIEDERFTEYMGDVRDLESVRGVFELFDFDIIFHAAAMKHLVVCENEPIETVKTNILGSNNIIRMAKVQNVPQLVAISTDKAAAPTCVMGATKFIAEQITINTAKETGNKYSCVRFGNVANSRGSVIPLMVKRIKEGKEIWISEPKVTRFIMRISDAVKLVLDASKISKGGEKFILKMKAFELKDLAEVMVKKIYPIISPTKSASKAKILGLSRGEKLDEELLNTIESENIFENKYMYLIPPFEMKEKTINKLYPGFNRAKVDSYNSRLADRMDQKELEKIIKEFIETN
jgi:FlaA1/EpsC-like NDP-sugar epimerase